MHSAITQIIHDMVLDGEVPAKVIATEINKPYTTMLREINPYDGGAKVGVDLLVPLMHAAHSVEPLKYLAQQMGYILVPMRATEVDDGDRMAMTLKLLEEFGEFSRSLQQVLGRKDVEPDEFGRVERSGYNAVMAAVELIETIRAQHQGQQARSASKAA